MNDFVLQGPHIIINIVSFLTPFSGSLDWIGHDTQEVELEGQEVDLLTSN